MQVLNLTGKSPSLTGVMAGHAYPDTSRTAAALAADGRRLWREPLCPIRAAVLTAQAHAWASWRERHFVLLDVLDPDREEKGAALRASGFCPIV